MKQFNINTKRSIELINFLNDLDNLEDYYKTEGIKEHDHQDTFELIKELTAHIECIKEVNDLLGSLINLNEIEVITTNSCIKNSISKMCNFEYNIKVQGEYINKFDTLLEQVYKWCNENINNIYKEYATLISGNVK